MQEEKYFLCRDCHVGKTMIYPESEETCPRLPEHSLCSDCGKQMMEMGHSGPYSIPHHVDCTDNEDVLYWDSTHECKGSDGKALPKRKGFLPAKGPIL